jgi:hypothetical protein
MPALCEARGEVVLSLYVVAPFAVALLAQIGSTPNGSSARRIGFSTTADTPATDFFRIEVKGAVCAKPKGVQVR